MAVNIQKDFTKGNIPQQLMVFSTPLLLSSLLQMIYNMVDMIIVGQNCGSVGLAAVSVGSDLVNFFTFVAIGFSSAGQVIIAQYLGAGKKHVLSKFFATMAVFMFTIALIFSGFSLVFLNTMLELMHTPIESYADTYSYAFITMSGLFFIYGYNMVAAILRGLGDSRHPFLFISLAAILNVILDLLLIDKYGLGPVGAAWATIVSQALSFIACVVFLHVNRNAMGIADDFSFSIDKDMLKMFLRLGVPMAIKSSSVHITKLFVNSWINSFGVIVAAVAGIANKLNAVSNLVSNSINTAGATMVGQNIGAEKYERVPKILWWNFAFSGSIMVVFGMLLVNYPLKIFGLFTEDKAVLDVAMTFLPYGLWMLAGCATRAPMNAIINGSGNHFMNYMIAGLDGFVMRLGSAILFGLVLNWGYTAFWLADAIAGFTPMVIGSIYLLSGKWKTNEYIIRKQ